MGPIFMGQESKRKPVRSQASYFSLRNNSEEPISYLLLAAEAWSQTTVALTDRFVQGVPLATEPGISS